MIGCHTENSGLLINSYIRVEEARAGTKDTKAPETGRQGGKEVG